MDKGKRDGFIGTGERPEHVVQTGGKSQQKEQEIDKEYLKTD